MLSRACKQLTKQLPLDGGIHVDVVAMNDASNLRNILQLSIILQDMCKDFDMTRRIATRGFS